MSVAASQALMRLLHADGMKCRLVISSLEPLPSDRKCFRLMNGVLVQRTVGDVLPSLKTNYDGLKKVLEELLKQYQQKQAEMETWKVSWRLSLM